jgi:hypothetical protein
LRKQSAAQQSPDQYFPAAADSHSFSHQHGHTDFDANGRPERHTDCLADSQAMVFPRAEHR